MEAKDVLSHYMETCQERNQCFQYRLASNAVLDWFGRTIQGNGCIERFLQCDVWPQYEQNFVAAAACAPIETRQTHEQAKETPLENAILCPSETPTSSGYESPPPSQRDLRKPPPLQRLKKFRRRVLERSMATSSSDDDDEPHTKSYNLRRTACETGQSQSKNVIPVKIEGRQLRKRVVEESPVQELLDDRSTSPMKRPKKMLDGIQKSPTCPASCSSADNDLSKPYSELKYLESVGSIRTIRRAKHPGINKVPTTKTITATPFVSPESQNGWDRKTKLKISYRTGLLKKDDIQFALIIYEPLTMVTRRNLLEEFQRAAMEDEQQKNKCSPLHHTAESILLKTPTIRAKPKNEKVSSLRRLRF